jgi:cation transporter-like permease
VKTAQYLLKKCLVLMLLGLYLFMASAYIVYHPKHIVLIPATSAANASSSLHGDNTSNNSFTQLHGALKSIIENNRKVINLLFKTTSLGFILIFLSATLAGLIRAAVFINKPLYFRFNNRVALCTLRI